MWQYWLDNAKPKKKIDPKKLLQNLTIYLMEFSTDQLTACLPDAFRLT